MWFGLIIKTSRYEPPWLGHGDVLWSNPLKGTCPAPHQNFRGFHMGLALVTHTGHLSSALLGIDPGKMVWWCLMYSNRRFLEVKPVCQRWDVFRVPKFKVGFHFSIYDLGLLQEIVDGWNCWNLCFYHQTQGFSASHENPAVTVYIISNSVIWSQTFCVYDIIGEELWSQLSCSGG